MTITPTSTGGAAIPWSCAGGLSDRDRVVDLLARIDAETDPVAAERLARYFQVRPGGYGEGDRFVGVKLSRLRVLVRPVVREPITPAALATGLRSPIHEHRRLSGRPGGVRRAGPARRRRRPADRGVRGVRRRSRVDNWDLVDCSAPEVVGGYLLDRDRAPLHDWVRSDSVWRRRIAIVATHRFIVAGQTSDTYALATTVLADRHDLIHKAAGWMLREAGKRVDEAELWSYLDRHAAEMPRTMLRYAIERLPTDVRRAYRALGR